MPEAVNYIILAIPVFFLLIGVEVLLDRAKRSGYYRLNDAISNLNAGITEQVSGVFAKFAVVGVYVWVYEQFRLTTVPDHLVTWVLLFLGIDFFYYWFHRLAHEVNLLWGGHVVHHQSEEYNLSVALRQGAFQKFGSFVFYLPLAFLGFNPIMFLVIGQFQTLYQFWIHTRMIGQLHPVIEFMFNTPSHHRVHHGRNPKYIDRNHGGTLIIWDRLFGTFQKEEEEVVYGITVPLQTWNPLRAQLDVWRDLGKQMVRVRGWKARLNTLFKAPGWRPEEWGGPILPKQVDPMTAVKFDVKLPRWLHMYAWIQFLFILAGTAWFLFSFEGMALQEQLVFAGLIIYSITVIGILMEYRAYAIWLEMIRVWLTILVTWWWLSADGMDFVLPSVVTLFSLISLLVFVSKWNYGKANH